MAALRSGAPSRLRQLLAAEASGGSPLKLGSEAPPEVKNFIDKVIRSPLQDIAIPLLGFRWEYNKCNIHHWEALFRHFGAYFKAYVSCRKDLLLLDITSENSGSFPKHAVLQILRVTQIILENCQGKGSFSGLEHFKVLLSSTDPEIVMATLETLLALVKINPSKLHVSGKLISCGSLNSHLLSLAQGWGSKEEGLGLYTCVVANEKSQDEHFSLFPSDLQDSSNESQLRLGSTLHFEFYTENMKDRARNSSKLQIIHIPDAHLQVDDDLTLLSQLVCEFDVPQERRFSLLTRIRYACSFRSPKTFRLYSRISLLAFIVLVQSNDAKDELVSFFANEPEYNNELIQLVRTEETIPGTVRTLAMLALGAQIAACASSHERARILTGPGIISVSGNQIVLSNVLQRAMHLLNENSSDLSSLSFVEALLQFYLLHVISSIRADSAFSGSGLVPTLLPLLQDADSTHIGLVCTAIKTLQKLMNYSSGAVSLFKDLGGIELLTHRLKTEVDRINCGSNDLMLIGDSSKTGDTLYAHKRVVKSLLKALGSAAYSPANPGNAANNTDNCLISLLSAIFCNANKFGGGIYFSAVTIMSDIIHKEPTCFSVLHEMSLFDAFFSSIKVGILPSSKVLRCIPSGLGAICLNAKGLLAVKETAALRFLVDAFTSKKYMVAMNEGVISLANSLEELLRHVSSLRSLCVDIIIEIVGKLALMGEITSRESSMNVDGDISMVTSSCDSLFDSGDPTLGRISNERFFIFCISHLLVLLHRMMDNSETCRVFVEKKGIEALMKLLLQISIVQSSEGMSIAINSNLVFRNFAQNRSGQLAQTFCSSLHEHLKNALTGITSVGSSFLLTPGSIPDSGIFSSLFIVDFLLFIAAARDARWTAALVSEFGSGSQDVLIALGRVHREILWQISLLDDAKVETRNNGPSTSAVSRRLETSAANEPDDQRGNSFWQLGNPLMRRRSLSWNVESQLLDLINLYCDLGRGSGFHQQMGFEGASRLTPASSLRTSSEDGGTSIKTETDQHRSHYFSCCYMLRTLSFHISSLFLELGKVSLLPPRRRDELFNLSPSTRAVVSTIASIVLDHLNFVGVADPSNSDGVISTKCRFLGKLVDFVDSILSERQDSCNPILINCFYGHGVVQTILTTFEATSQLLFAVSRGPASPIDTEGRGLTGSEENESNNSWIYGPLASYGKLMDHLVTSSFIISPSTKHLLAPPLFPANIPYPHDPEAFVKRLQSKVLKAVLPIWAHPQFNECSCDFITVILSIMRHIYTGVDVKNVNVSSGARVPSLPVDESAISLIVEMGFSRSRAEEALRQVGSNSVELAMEWLFSHPEETQEDDELARALAMSLGGSELSMKGVSAGVPDSTEQEDEVVQLPSVDEMLPTFAKLLQMEKPLAFPVRDFLLLICSQNKGHCRTKVVMFILDHLQLSGGNEFLLSALFLVLALVLHEDRAAREVAQKGGLVRIALEFLSQWDAGLCKGEVPKWVTTAFLAIDRMLLVDPNQGSEISSAEQLEKDNNAKQTPVVPDKKSYSLQSLLALNSCCVDLSQQKKLIGNLCRCIECQLPSETMHVVLQLCATLTKVHSVAITFLEEGGLHSLLSLPTSSLVRGLDNVAATIVRHILEDPLTLQQAMETEIRHIMLRATNIHSNRRITPRLFLQNLSTVVLRDPEVFLLATKSLCQVEMVGERPHIVLCQDYEKEKKGSENDKDKQPDAVDKNVSGKQFDSHAKGGKVHRKPPHSFVSVIEYLLDMIMTFIPRQKDSSPISGASPTLPLADVEIDGTTSSKAKGKAVAALSKEKSSGFQDASATLAKTVFVLKLLTEIVLTYASSIHILLKKDTEISSVCEPIQCNYSVNGGGRNGIFRHVIHKFLAYPISCKKGGSEKLEGDWRHKLTSRTHQLLVASSIRSAESRRRILFEINSVFSELVESTDGCMVPCCNLKAYIELLNDILAGRTPTGSCVSAEASSTFIDVGLVRSLTNILKILDLDHSDSAKIASGIVNALESVTREHVRVANNSSSKEQSFLNPNSDENQSTRTDNADGRNRLRVMETVPQPNLAAVLPGPIQASGSSPSGNSEMVRDQGFDGNEDDSIHETPEVHGGMENGSIDSIGISIDVAHNSPANSDADDEEEMEEVGDDGDEDDEHDEHNNMEDVMHHMSHVDTDQDDHEIDEDDFDNDLLEIENEDDEDDENGVILRLEESINGINVHDEIEALGRDNSLSNETLGVSPLEVFGSRQRGRTTSIYNLLARSGEHETPLQHPLLVDPSSSRPVTRRQSDTAVGGLSARGLSRLDAIFRSLRNGRHEHQFNMWLDESQPRSNGPSGAVIPQGFEEILVSQLRPPSKQQALDQNTTLQQQDNDDANQVQKAVELRVEIASEANVNNEDSNIVFHDDDSERAGIDVTVPSENDLQLGHDNAVVLGVQVASQESGGSGVTSGECLHSVEVEIRNADGYDDRGEGQGPTESLRTVSSSHEAAMPATGQDGSLLQNDHDALPLSSPEQNQNVDIGADLEQPREVEAGFIDPAIFESPERLTAVTPSHGAAIPATEQDATLLQNDREALPPSDPEENQNMDSGAGVERPREVEAGSIDPTFLEALPEELRAEVLSGQQNQATQPSNEQTQGAGEIDPEFLAALPPDILDEVLTQQQAQRRNLSQELEGQPVDMDTVSIIATFPSDLREEVLLTSSDAILANLTPALVAEANMLRERYAHRYSHNFLGFHPRNRRGESSRQVDGVGSNGERAIGSIGSRRIEGKIIEANGAPLVDQEALKAMIRLFRVVQPLYKGQLQRLLLNLCVHSETRTALVQILMGMLMLDMQWPLKDIDGSQEPPCRLYACQSHVTYLQPKYSNGVPALVSRRILETLTYLARNHPYVAKLLLHQELPRLPARNLKISDQTSGKAVMIVKEGKTNDKDSGVVLLLGLLNLPLYLRSTAHLEQLLGLLDVVIDNVGNNSRQSKKSLSSEEPSASQSSTQLASEASKPATEPSVSAVNSDRVTSSILRDLPDLELRLLCSLLARDGLSDSAYALVSKVLYKLVDIAPIYCHFFLTEFAESVQTLMRSAVDELRSYEKEEKLTITTASSSGTAILRVLQALSFLISLLHEKVKNHLLLSKKDFSAVSQVLKINSTLEPLWMELSSCISKIESSSQSVLEMPSTSAVASGLRNSSVSPLPRRALDILPYIESLFMTCEKLHPGESSCGHDNSGGVNVQVEDTNTSCSVHKTSCLRAKVDEKEVVLVKFLEKHRKLLNAFIRQNPGLLEKSFSVLLQLPRFIDFDNKRAHFKSNIKHKHDHHHSSLRISVRRAYMLEDSYNQLRLRSTQELKGKLTVNFQGEEGIDAGGLTREWYQLLSRVIFDKGALLFTTVGNDSTFQPNPNSSYQTEHLSYFKFVGRVVGKALFDGQLLDVHFTRSFYKHILGVKVTYHDIEAIEPAYFKNLKWVLENDISNVLDMTFTLDADEEKLILYEKTQVTVCELIPGGRNIKVTEENKHQYVDLRAEHRLTTAIRPQINAFLEGFYELIPRELISIFNDKELELLISGLPEIDLDDLQENTEYSGYTAASPVVQWFWEVVQGFSKEDKARLLQFVTGTSKVPLEGFSALQGISGSQRFQIHKAYGSANHLPSAHTCFNQLDLPEYPSKEQLRERLLMAIHEGSEGFGFG